MKKFAFGISAACGRDSSTFRGVCLFSALILSIACGSLARADSKSAAEFMLKICSEAMDDFAKVTAVARDDLWVEAAVPTIQKYETSKSAWTVTQGDQKFFVLIWVSLIGEEVKLPPLKACAVNFPGNDVNRDEFFNFASSSLDLEFAMETKFPRFRTEGYELKSCRPKKIVLSIMSDNNGTVRMAMMQEMHIFAIPRRPAPGAPPGVTVPSASPEVTIPTSRPQTAIQQACSEQATARGLHGEERREFRAECKKKLAMH
jgi:hypothetical protein